MEPLDKKPSLALKLRILETVFGYNSAYGVREAFDAYFRYYESELLKASQFRRRVTAQAVPSFAAKSHEDILKAIQMLQAKSHHEKRTIRHDLLQSGDVADEDAVNDLLEISVRLWLLLNQVLASTFTAQSKWTLEARASCIHPSFTASFMVGVCGLKLEWTTCLADHLRFDRRQRTLRIFPYKSIMKLHLEMAQNIISGARRSPLPYRLSQESLWTLNLLFPHWDHATNQLLKGHNQDFQARGPYDLPPAMNFVEFGHWRDRLVELHDLVFLSPPVSWAQLWTDRRNPQQFWTFWIALVRLLLTLISTTATVIQAWAAVKSLKLMQ